MSGSLRSRRRRPVLASRQKTRSPRLVEQTRRPSVARNWAWPTLRASHPSDRPPPEVPPDPPEPPEPDRVTTTAPAATARTTSTTVPSTSGRRPRPGGAEGGRPAGGGAQPGPVVGDPGGGPQPGPGSGGAGAAPSYGPAGGAGGGPGGGRVVQRSFGALTAGEA